MTSFFLSNASHSRRLPLCSVAFLLLRPPRAPPPEPPSPATPPEPPDPPDSQICFSFSDSSSQPLSSSSLPALVSPVLHLSFAVSGSTSLVRLPLLPAKIPLFVGLLPHDKFGGLDTRLWPTSSTTDSFSDARFLVDATTFPPQKFPQVCSYSSPYNSPKIGRVWMLIEFVALVLWNLVLWNSDVAHSVSMGLDTLVSTLLLSCSTFIALMRSFTAVCGFCLDLAMLKVVSLQLGQRALSSDNLPVFLVLCGFHSPHLSFMELFILPNTSLVFSDNVTGSIVCKTVLLEVEARIVVQDCSRSAFADCLMSVSLEALFPPHGGFDKVFQAKGVCLFGCSWLVAALVELLSSPLSPSLILSVVFVSFRLCSISLLVDAFVYPALGCHVVSSVGRG
ncbi:hypothetical protein ISN45_Aa05g024150 [Arabidopsis thaliana x Arabidopsis arenosa]|uniref:Uncharacterized protein n=1 Tax=Arabidopsis thaliana x Arabidopsis arenosa TaxID=1240361 RepID=A0A8T1ZQM8_9BRAS|nr:hypothetical protein ISN45_Aa05g024150 [Arabidopsis thaliana x Arabidopsis arenosa]